MANVETKRTATDALIEALEMGDDIKHVVILYVTKGENDRDGALTDGDISVPEINWLIDRYKNFLVKDTSDET